MPMLLSSAPSTISDLRDLRCRNGVSVERLAAKLALPVGLVLDVENEGTSITGDFFALWESSIVELARATRPRRRSIWSRLRALATAVARAAVV